MLSLLNLGSEKEDNLCIQVSTRSQVNMDAKELSVKLELVEGEREELKSRVERLDVSTVNSLSSYNSLTAC